jgi:hypothetical protein
MIVPLTILMALLAAFAVEVAWLLLRGAGYKLAVGHHRRAAQRRTRQGINILVTGRWARDGDTMSRGCRAINDDRANADAD